MSERLVDQITCGDQYPLGGGLLRAEAAKNFASGVTYFVHDGDTPTSGDNASAPHVSQGNPDYWGFGTRIPLALSHANPSVELEAMRQSLKSPQGIVYLAGRDERTINSQKDDPSLGGHVKKILRTEAAWMRNLANLSGNGAAIARADDILAVVENLNGDGPMKAIESVSAVIHPGAEIGSFVDSFRGSPPLLLNLLPTSKYWLIDGRGNRSTYQGGELKEGEVVTPKGKALPLELAARGLTLGYTGLSYLPEVVALRDKYVPGLKIRLLQISFDWDVDPVILEAAWDEFSRRKKARGQLVEKPESELADVLEAARRRPTSVAAHVLGGEIKTKQVYTEV